MPVLFGTIGVALNVANQFTVGLCCSIKTEGNFNGFILQVAIDGLWATNDLNPMAFVLEELSQDGCVGIGIIATDDDQGGNVVALANFCTDFELFFTFKFCASTSDDVKPTCIAIGGKIVSVDDSVGILENARGPPLESVEVVLRVCSLQGIKESADDIVPTGGLSAAEDYPDVALFGNTCVVSLCESDLWQTVCTGE